MSLVLFLLYWCNINNKLLLHVRHTKSHHDNNCMINNIRSAYSFIAHRKNNLININNATNVRKSFKSEKTLKQIIFVSQQWTLLAYTYKFIQITILQQWKWNRWTKTFSHSENGNDSITHNTHDTGCVRRQCPWILLHVLHNNIPLFKNTKKEREKNKITKINCIWT